MRISDWSSDVCSTDLYSREMTSGTPAAAIAPIDMTIDELRGALARVLPFHAAFDGWTDAALAASAGELNVPVERARPALAGGDRKGVGEGKGVSVRVDLGGRRISKKKNKYRRY